ncbi:ARM repeat-containing protein [Patellaria atrata CBS 101060]|uniref:ARM repeat-containing protein n=1 Tax=Patellaria atrata CBS 101060 TaxID=1346257 RepID=A0A9P4SH43_9PEZI|nr:ARM repeat-containing protein [Patellaria atrata CBS 101060]
MESGSISAPTSIVELEALVQRFYQPASPKVISQIEQQLQTLQRSPDGWQMADALLSSTDEKSKFFGALTFTVKLNQDWSSLDIDQTHLLLSRLVSWTVRLIAANEKPLVTKKLCTTLVTYFSRPTVSWSHSIRHLICCFYKREFIPEDTLDHFPRTVDMVTTLTPYQITATLWYASSLVEEAAKTDPNSQHLRAFHERIEKDLQDAVILMQYSLRQHSETYATDAFKCFVSWVFYGQRAWTHSSENINLLRSLINPSLELIVISDDTDVIEGMIEMINGYESLFKQEHSSALSNLLRGDWARQYLGDIESDAEASGSAARLLCAYGVLEIHSLIQYPQNQERLEIMVMLHQLLRRPGYTDAIDNCEVAIQFWDTFVSTTNELLVEETAPSWLPSVQAHTMQAVEEYVQKIRYPTREEARHLDSDEMDRFSSLRVEVSDWMQEAFTLLGLSLVERLSTSALVCLERNDWEGVEAYVYGLSALSGSIGEGESEDSLLTRVFGSSLFSELTSPQNRAVPSTIRRTIVNTIGNYADYFRRHFEVVSGALNFLFASLAAHAPSSQGSSTPQGSMANSAAKSILSLCYSCRTQLTSQLDAFIQQYEMFLQWPAADMTTKEKVIGAIAAIIQALDSDEEKVVRLQTVFVFIERDFQTALQRLETASKPSNEYNQEEEYEAGKQSALTVLKCLTAIGKAFQATEDAVVDLEYDESAPSFWAQGQGLEVQRRMLHWIEVLYSAAVADGDIIEEVCHIFRCGFTETTPGPFVFPAPLIVNFLIRHDMKSPRAVQILSTVSSFLSSHSSNPDRVNNEVLHLAQYIITLMEHNQRDAKVKRSPFDFNDPEVMKGCYDAIHRFVRYYHKAFFQFPQAALDHVFNTAVWCLICSDILPKRAASSFFAEWIKLIPQYPDPEKAVAQSMVAKGGPVLCGALISSVGGNAARSELDLMAEPLRKLVTYGPEVQQWLKDALNSGVFPSKIANEEDRKRFLQQIIAARGSTATNKIVKEFWMRCRGTGVAYGS